MEVTEIISQKVTYVIDIILLIEDNNWFRKMSDSTLKIGGSIYALAKRLWPINRSITGNGVRETLSVLKKLLPDLEIHEVPSGVEVFDWTIPDEWNVREAWLEDPNGRRICDYSEHNLHLVGYSIPIDKVLSLEELQANLHSLPEMPEAIPYVTSYYSRRWGFCMRDSDRKKLLPGNYRVYIDATLAPGSLTYGELVIPGETDDEVFLSTNICHPSMANNELSGPCVTTYLAKWLSELPGRRYTYRIIFIPETIGAITYLSKNITHLKRHVVAGFNVCCIGDEKSYTFLASRAGNTLSDQVALHVLKHLAPDFKRYSFLDRGSDERQYCAPGVDLPVASIMRSRYLDFPEYHTSLDDLELITPAGLEGGFMALRRAIEALEVNCTPKAIVLGEPHLSKRGLYPTLNTLSSHDEVKSMMNLIAYSDGKHSLLSIAELIGTPIWELVQIFQKLEGTVLIK
jgi:aminopeptidase-like protein